jgi:peptidoglycan/xylan/chitin deacetylase (PgdA/CDA1 family)
MSDAASRDVSVCLTFDFDAISVWIGPRGSKSPNLIARGEFGEVGANRLVDLLAEYRVSSTWFIPGHTIDTYPAVCERVVTAGHEVGYHGYCHEAPSSQRDEADERAILDKSIDCIERLIGQARGHRVPGGNVGERWVRLPEYALLRLVHGTQRLRPHVARRASTDAAFEFGSSVDLSSCRSTGRSTGRTSLRRRLTTRACGRRTTCSTCGATSSTYLYRRSGGPVLTMHPSASAGAAGCGCCAG